MNNDQQRKAPDVDEDDFKVGDEVVFTDVNTYGYGGRWTAPGAPAVVTDGPDWAGEYGVLTTLADCSVNQVLWVCADDIRRIGAAPR